MAELPKTCVDKTTVIVGDFNIPLSVINRTNRKKKISKDVAT